jgi:hypothetical protein
MFINAMQMWVPKLNCFAKTTGESNMHILMVVPASRAIAGPNKTIPM